jgi:hypothetical protein
MKANPRGGFNPKTGAATDMRAKPPVMTDAAKTSRDTQKQITRPPQPFNGNSTVQQKVGTTASGGISTNEPKILSGMKRSSPGVRALPPRGPVGQKKAINQSGQVNGRMGTSFPRRKGAYPAGYKAKRNANFFGE